MGGASSALLRWGKLRYVQSEDQRIVLKHPIDHYFQNGYTTQAIIDNLTKLGAKFQTPAQTGLPEAGFYGCWKNFMPRLGFAYLPSFGLRGTVICGGYGRYIYPVPIRNSVRYLTAVYPFTEAYSQNYNAANQSPEPAVVNSTMGPPAERPAERACP
jgi:hypothetical protein